MRVLSAESWCCAHAHLNTWGLSNNQEFEGQVLCSVDQKNSAQILLHN